MTAEIINLRQARKRRERGEREAKAAENRERYGTPKANRRLDEATRLHEERAMDGKLRIDPGNGSPDRDRD